MKGLLYVWTFCVLVVNAQEFQTGAARLLSEFLPQLSDKRLGLVVNQTSMVNKTHLVDTLWMKKANISAIFAPEHGFRGDADAGASIQNSIDTKTKIPIYSLFGKTLKPTPEMLANIDVILFDVQDIGARFYTYISTLTLVMEAAAEQHKEVWVLDRPNPNGNVVAGPVLEKNYTSFVGMHEVPILHGLTIGEYANMVNGEHWLKNGVQCQLKVITMPSWTHNTTWEETQLTWVKPSPNIPDIQTARWYPYVCWFEGMNVSVGRGTYKPFLMLGAPFLNNKDFNSVRSVYDLDTLIFTPKSIKGMSNKPPFELQNCKGIYLNRLPERANECFELSLQLAKIFYLSSGKRTDMFQPFFLKLCGTEQVKKAILAGFTTEQIVYQWQDKLLSYQKKRKKYLLYEE